MQISPNNVLSSMRMLLLLTLSLFAQATTKSVAPPETLTLQLKKGKSVDLKAYRLSCTYLGLDALGQALLELNYNEKDSYKATPHSPGSGSKSPETYSTNLNHYVDRIYRTHYYCNGELQSDIHDSGYEIIDLDKGYRNFTGHSMYAAQCIDDGSFDTYYDDVADYGVISFRIRVGKSDGVFSVIISEATKRRATIQISTLSPPKKKTTPIYSRPQTNRQVPHNTSIQLLRDLKKLLDDGIITQEEYDVKKQEILKRL